MQIFPRQSNNAAFGDSSLYWNGNGAAGSNQAVANSAVGSKSLFKNTVGSYNTATGFESLYSNTTGSNNTACGSNALRDNTTGFMNTAVGYDAMINNTDGYDNTALGKDAMFNNSSGTTNTATGMQALYLNSTGGHNTASGYAALFSNTTDNNSAFGYRALFSTTTGTYNTSIGYEAGSNVITGSNNTFIGATADCGILGTVTNATAIGYGASITANNHFVFGNGDVVGWGFGVESGARAVKVGTTSSNGNGAYLTAGGTWTNTSAREKKEDFQTQDRNSILEKINQLEVTKWKYKGTDNEYHYGPMADDFHRLFEVGDDSSTSDMDKTGVLFLGIQAVDERARNQESRVKTLEDENEKLSEENESLKLKDKELNERITALETIFNKSEMSDGIVKLSGSEDSGSLLGQNIPNPFDNSTLIPFRIPKDCNDASIVISESATGKIVRVIPVACGETQISIEAGMLASGTYSYSLYVDGRMINTKSMELVR